MNLKAQSDARYSSKSPLISLLIFLHLGPPGHAAGGVPYIRWGRTTCPNTVGTQLLYDGLMTGSHWDEGGSAGYICLHKQPQLLSITPGIQSERGYLYGTEFKTVENPPHFSNMAGHDIPCALCYTPTRNAEITIPGRTSCPSSWTREYYSYLMADRYGHKGGEVPVCVDVNAESVPGSDGVHDDSLLYFLEARCEGIRCPPYSDGAEITCVVCTK